MKQNLDIKRIFALLLIHNFGVIKYVNCTTTCRFEASKDNIDITFRKNKNDFHLQYSVDEQITEDIITNDEKEATLTFIKMLRTINLLVANRKEV